MLRNKSFTVEITGKLAHQSPQGNMQKLFDCIRPLLKHFLACLTFHRKEIRLRHLHKRTNPGSAPVAYHIFVKSISSNCEITNLANTRSWGIQSRAFERSIRAAPVKKSFSQIFLHSSINLISTCGVFYDSL